MWKTHYLWMVFLRCPRALLQEMVSLRAAKFSKIMMVAIFYGGTYSTHAHRRVYIYINTYISKS